MNIKTKKRKPRKLVRYFFLCFCLSISFCFLLSQHAQAAFEYKLLEQFPGFFNAGSSPSFPDLLSAIYKFFIWTVGIAAFFMLTVGGFLYVTSAGNNASITTAKNIITDAIIGLVAVLTAYILLYVINPDLVKLNLNLISLNLNELRTEQSETRSVTGGGRSDKKCTPETKTPCSVETLSNTCFGAAAKKASSICHLESEGVPALESTSDVCIHNGKKQAFSVGLFQVNLIANGYRIPGCDKLFNTYGGGMQGKRIGNKGYDCEVKSGKEAQYEECKRKLKDASFNIQISCKILRLGWNQWSTNKSCHF